MTLAAPDDVSLRPATLSDARMLFDWANDSEVRQNAINQSAIIWENHLQWLTKKLEANNTVILVMERAGEALGQIRFDEEENGQWIIDYSIDKSHRGKGYGKSLLTKSIAYLQSMKLKGVLVGMVKASNRASAAAFKKCGFEESESGDMLKFVYAL